MADKQTHTEEEGTVSGRNVYVDNRGRTIYYNRFTKTNYIIRENAAKAYNTYSLRFFMGFLVGYTIAIFSSSLLYGVLGGCAVYAVMAFMFYKKYLPELPTETHFVPYKKPTIIEDLALNMTYTRLVLAVLISLTLAGALLVNAYYNLSDSSSIMSLNYILAAAAVAFAICCGIAIYKKAHLNK